MRIPRFVLASSILVTTTVGAAAVERVNPHQVLEQSRRDRIEQEKRMKRDAAEQRRREREQRVQREKEQRTEQEQGKGKKGTSAITGEGAGR
jgi:hypothetical protein